ncbi:MAG: hypothetical protein ACYDHB_10925 [Candidatus Dormibacteria bacterium]
MARAYRPSRALAAAMACSSRCQLMVGLPALVPVVTVSSPAGWPVRIWATLASTCFLLL